jgi:hypothetical protein
MNSTLTKSQHKTFRVDINTARGPVVHIAKVRYDDQCGNGHNSFAITCETYEKGGSRDEPSVTHKGGRSLRMSSCGCQHDIISKHFPQLAPLLKWHLCSSDGPMHYIANTLYQAGDADCHGHHKGEPSSYDYAVYWRESPFRINLNSWQAKRLGEYIKPGAHKPDIYEIAHTSSDGHKYASKFTFDESDKWHNCPFGTYSMAVEVQGALQFGHLRIAKVARDFSEGKERELDAARRSAVWPDATDAELTEPGLKERLEARLPALLDEFKTAVESLGFTY